MILFLFQLALLLSIIGVLYWPFVVWGHIKRKRGGSLWWLIIFSGLTLFFAKLVIWKMSG